MPRDDLVTPEDRRPQTLAPVLGLFTAVALVIGEVIGSGIFIKPNQVAQATGGYVGLILLLWIGCGLVALCGALTLSELSAMLPHAGGTYVFLREAYGRLWAFLWGWAEFWVIRTGAIAALATAMTMALEELLVMSGYLQPDESHRQFQTVVATLVIALLATVNIVRTRWGGMVQVATTAIKACSLVFLAVLPFIAAESSGRLGTSGALWPPASEIGLLAGLGGALSAILWTYDGWGQVTVVAEEVRNPQRNMPLALAGGVLVLIMLYAGANLTYHLTLPAAEIAAAKIPAADVTEKLLPGVGRRLVLAMLLVSTFGALNSNILVGPRVLFAVGRDFRRLGWAGRIDPRTGTPALAIAAVSSWAIALVWAGDLSPNPNKRLFDVLTDYAIFGGSVFYFTEVFSVFVLRWRRPDLARPYRTLGYPVVPSVFVVSYVFLLVSMFWAAPFECTSGLTLIALGLVAFWLVFAPRGHRSDSG